MRCVRAGATTVLNLAAGLDARPFRLDLPRDLRWIHADLPPMVDYFRERMQAETPRCDLEYVAVDLREEAPRRELFARVAGLGPTLVITEGLLLYLPEPAVAGLARELHDSARPRWWLTDLASPRLLKMLEKRWSPTLQAGNAPFVFGPAEGSAWFAPFGWRELEWRSTFGESLRINRTLRGGALFWRCMDRLQPRARREAGQRMSGILLLGNNDDPASTRSVKPCCPPEAASRHMDSARERGDQTRRHDRHAARGCSWRRHLPASAAPCDETGRQAGGRPPSRAPAMPMPPHRPRDRRRPARRCPASR